MSFCSPHCVAKLKTPKPQNKTPPSDSLGGVFVDAFSLEKLGVRHSAQAHKSQRQSNRHEPKGLSQATHSRHQTRVLLGQLAHGLHELRLALLQRIDLHRGCEQTVFHLA